MDDQSRHILVKVSPNRWVVAERDPPYVHGWKACSKPMKRGPAGELCRLTNDVAIEDWPAWTNDAVIEL